LQLTEINLLCHLLRFSARSRSILLRCTLHMLTWQARQPAQCSRPRRQRDIDDLHPADDDDDDLDDDLDAAAAAGSDVDVQLIDAVMDVVRDLSVAALASLAPPTRRRSRDRAVTSSSRDRAPLAVRLLGTPIVVVRMPGKTLFVVILQPQTNESCLVVSRPRPTLGRIGANFSFFFLGQRTNSLHPLLSSLLSSLHVPFPSTPFRSKPPKYS